MKLVNKKGIFHAQFKTTQGTTKTITTRCTNRADAERVVKESGLKDLELAARAGRLTQEAIGYLISGRKLTLQKALEDYQEWMETRGKSPRTIMNNVHYIRSWITAAQVEALPPAAITEKHISDWINNRESQTKANSRTIMLAAIRSFFFFIAGKGWTPNDPSKLVSVNYKILSHVQKETTVKRVFTAAEYDGLVKATDGFWRFAIQASRELGLRLGDICQLEWDCFRQPGYITVWTDKRDKRVSLKMSDGLAQAATLQPVAHARYVFPEERDIINDPTRRAYLSVSFTRICARLGLKGKSFHCLRHTFATESNAEGRSLTQIASDMGHSSTRTTEGYVHKI
ncbi:tyrosine-type recombinase/integrase [Pedosphaera parvula]|uniref:Integrase family protein n=1 Tax=Pedosphaera parvula (strain Ellin514) TaxID=320771 RepID=B9XA06_PEDPL|nr:tyrosine-type recombinase/integrase [Pedosphaera parvula]EEF63347.1 integrase family protein [Pedosphaera parvula Ellin514]